MRGKILAEYSLLIAWATISIFIVLILHQANYIIAFLTFGAVISAALLIAWAWSPRHWFQSPPPMRAVNGTTVAITKPNSRVRMPRSMVEVVLH